VTARFRVTRMVLMACPSAPRKCSALLLERLASASTA
jgi:hypothetical protein